MRLFPSDRYHLPLPEGHRFPVEKYRALRKRLEAEAAAGAALEFIEPHAATDEEILRVHKRAYVGRVMAGTLTPAEVRRIGFPWSEQLVARSLRSTGAAVDAAAAALEDGIAASLAGGTHHAGSDWGEGYCVFNDTAVAAREMQARGMVERVVILDLDVHQGNGTAEIFAADPSVFTVSVHGARNFPLRKHPGDLDIGLEDDADDSTYLAAVDAALAGALGEGGGISSSTLPGPIPMRGIDSGGSPSAVPGCSSATAGCSRRPGPPGCLWESSVVGATASTSGRSSRSTPGRCSWRPSCSQPRGNRRIWSFLAIVGGLAACRSGSRAVGFRGG